MNETLDSAIKFVPDDEELEAAGIPVDLVDPKLTPDEIEALTAREDRGLNNPVLQHEPKDLAEFMDWQNNFYTTFDSENKFSGFGKRRSKAFQRFAVLYPDLAQRTIDLMFAYKAKNFDERVEGFGPELSEALYDSYKEMAQLVDAGDRYIMTSGEPDRYYLKR